MQAGHTRAEIENQDPSSTYASNTGRSKERKRERNEWLEAVFEVPARLLANPHAMTAARHVIPLLESRPIAVVPPTPLLRSLDGFLLTWLGLVEMHDDQVAGLIRDLTDAAVVEDLHLLAVRPYSVLGLTALFDFDDFGVMRWDR